MTNFIITVLCMGFTAWIVWVVSYKAGHMDGYMRATSDLISPSTSKHICDEIRCRLAARGATTEEIAGAMRVGEVVPVGTPVEASCMPPGCNDYPECDHRY